MTEVASSQVHRILGCGSERDGEQVVVRLEAEPGHGLALRCPMGLLPQLMDMFRSAGALAAGARRGRAGPQADLIQPYVSAGPPRVIPTLEGPLLLRFQTTEGIPLSVAMPRTHLQDLARAVEHELAKSPPTLSKH